MNWLCLVENPKYGIITANFKSGILIHILEKFWRQIIIGAKIEFRLKHEWSCILYLVFHYFFTFVGTLRTNFILCTTFLFSSSNFLVMLTMASMPKILDELNQKDIALWLSLGSNVNADWLMGSCFSEMPIMFVVWVSEVPLSIQEPRSRIHVYQLCFYYCLCDLLRNDLLVYTQAESSIFRPDTMYLYQFEPCLWGGYMDSFNSSGVSGHYSW